MADSLPMFPLNAVLFPGVSVPLTVFEDRYRALVHHLLRVEDPAERVFGTVGIREGYELWAEKVNSSGGMLGRKVELIFRDDASDPNRVVSDYESLITRDKVDLVFGPFSRKNTVPRKKIASRKWPARKFAVRRTVSVIGRMMMFETNSITIRIVYRSHQGASPMMQECFR